ncbi:ubiquinone biosynthesis protein COQ7-domain-containing protein [Clohesyomyces aquaticus]|uniref:5-demethoxyubiquinone hydroxylase, mitochondrial n=1 Tax=Clohesyomyces aquaticus TaxID=1231657 RepID=A0A1Y1YGM9_9PLEO|nr:ubiquinone biosynthesis protein COQ7-domain-containing protein [Clohesyomyces aquaticus]
MPSLLFSTANALRQTPRHAQFPLFDFLVPSLRLATPRKLRGSPFHSTASPIEQPPSAGSGSHADNGKPRTTLTQEQRDFLDSALRVNQAGELAAVLIYSSQTPLLIRSHPHLRPLMEHMYSQEASHFSTFNTLIARHRVRPTLMYPVWKAAATALGWSTGLLGREAAMACTEAVETEIGGHYNEQVRVLLDWAEKLDERGQGSEELGGLLKELRRIRDEELEHLDCAVENDAKEARPYELLTNVIRGGCRTAIWISEKI